jgi:hypothetical protein
MIHRTRLPVPQTSGVSGFLALSQEGRADYGSVDGDDGVFTGLYGSRVPDSSGPEGAGDDLANSKRSTGAASDGPVGFQYFVGIHVLVAPGQWPVVLPLTEEHGNLLKLLGKPYIQLYGVTSP